MGFVLGSLISAASAIVLVNSSTSARWSGHRLLAELNVAVEPTLTVDQGHAIADDVHGALLREVPRLAEVMVHVDPHDHEPHGS